MIELNIMTISTVVTCKGMKLFYLCYSEKNWYLNFYPFPSHIMFINRWLYIWLYIYLSMCPSLSRSANIHLPFSLPIFFCLSLCLSHSACLFLPSSPVTYYFIKILHNEEFFFIYYSIFQLSWLSYFFLIFFSLFYLYFRWF